MSEPIDTQKLIYQLGNWCCTDWIPSARGNQELNAIHPETLMEQAADELDRLRAIEDAAIEISEVARLRGDDELPHPCDDPKLWTARMQTAWDDLREALNSTPEAARAAREAREAKPPVASRVSGRVVAKGGGA